MVQRRDHAPGAVVIPPGPGGFCITALIGQFRYVDRNAPR